MRAGHAFTDRRRARAIEIEPDGPNGHQRVGTEVIERDALHQRAAGRLDDHAPVALEIRVAAAAISWLTYEVGDERVRGGS